ncbi:TonB-dependent receptor [Catenovulum sp. 2E275]|uniref:TonB-dependent receptor domain-containing protein n=1 Tax=Catenovulum sp. 2E275 TaxID=2980497 RepID=UPI0021D0B541|nr:TonB-dependent receptor [Catenovulum sp. 2E275]MCU4675218.1 TonB-dependent receptor [Catenovulum sp. 2E275]
MKKAFALTSLCAAMLASNSAIAEEKIETIVVTATGYEQLETTAPASISVITTDEIVQVPIRDLGDVLKGLAGVSVNNYAGGRNDIMLRGLNEDYILFLVDGKRVSSSNGLWRGGNFDYTSIPLESIDHVEVVRGPMSALYGSDAVGGVINIITRNPGKEWQTTVNAEYSKMTDGDGGNRYRANLYTSGQLSENLGLVASLEKADQDIWVNEEVTPGYDTTEARETLKFNTTLRWAINQNQSLDIDFAYDKDDVPPTNYGGAVREQSIDRITLGLTHSAEWSWGGTKILANRSSADLYDYNTRYRLQPPLGRDIEEIFTTFRASAFTNLGAHSLTIGTEYLNTEIKDPVQYPVKGGDDQSLTSLFAQDEISLSDKLTATLGVRVENSDDYGTHSSPRAYLVYEATQDVVIKGGVGTAFRAPSLYQASPSFLTVSCGGACDITGNPDLKEETSVNTEVSVLVNKAGWNLSLTAFNNKVEDMITTAVVDGNRQWLNVNEVDIKGLEAGFGFKFGVLSTDINYTYLKTEDNNGNELSYRPEHSANVKLSAALTDTVSLFTNVNYRGEHQGNASQDLDGYATVSLGANYQVSEAFKLRAGLTNATDTQPIIDDPATTDSEGNTIAGSDMVMRGRSYFVGATYKF